MQIKSSKEITGAFMKINEYVNSKDIRKYWKEICYQPSPLESAWIIWQGKNQTVKEKHNDWYCIVNDTLDCAIPAGAFNLPQPSLHQFLKRYMKLEEELIASFYKVEPNAVYSYRMYFDDAGDRDWYNEPALSIPLKKLMNMQETVENRRILISLSS